MYVLLEGTFAIRKLRCPNLLLRGVYSSLDRLSTQLLIVNLELRVLKFLEYISGIIPGLLLYRGCKLPLSLDYGACHISANLRTFRAFRFF